MSPRSEEQNTLLKDERREQILSAALKVFALRGFSATKISDIVAEGGISHGLLYHYFSSKEEIFFELVSRALFHSGQMLLAMEGLPISPIEQVRQTARGILGGIEQGKETSYYFMIVIHASVMENAEKDKYMQGGDVAISTMVRILSEGQRLGQVREGDVGDFALVFFSAIFGLAVYKLTMPDFKMPDPEILVDLIKK